MEGKGSKSDGKRSLILWAEPTRNRTGYRLRLLSGRSESGLGIESGCNWVGEEASDWLIEGWFSFKKLDCLPRDFREVGGEMEWAEVAGVCRRRMWVKRCIDGVILGRFGGG